MYLSKNSFINCLLCLGTMVTHVGNEGQENQSETCG